MKTLFVCWQNVSRSQMAAAFYNHVTGTQDASSAGTGVDLPGETLAEHQARGRHAADVALLQHDGIDISGNKRTQLTPDMLAQFERVINMAEPAYTPDWLPSAPNYTYWPVENPGEVSPERANATWHEIKQRVSALIENAAGENREATT